MSETLPIEGAGGTIRLANVGDMKEIAEILAEAFPTLYESTLGVRGKAESAFLLHQLYSGGHLTLEDTHLFVSQGRISGVAVLHAKGLIGRGSPWDFGRLVYRHLGLFRGGRAFFGGLAANLLLAKRIPHAPDLVYIEALAVQETCRGQGIGTLLLAEAERLSRERGRSRIALHVLHRNLGAYRLYRRLGFLPWDKKVELPSPETPLSPPWATLLMVRNLE